MKCIVWNFNWESYFRDIYKSIVSDSWLKTRNGISTDFRDVYDINGLRKYLSKEICRKSELGVDIENCHKTIS